MVLAGSAAIVEQLGDRLDSLSLLVVVAKKNIEGGRRIRFRGGIHAD
jgi:hypothetical protein